MFLFHVGNQLTYFLSQIIYIFFVFKDNIKINLEIFHSQHSKITGEYLRA